MYFPLCTGGCYRSLSSPLTLLFGTQHWITVLFIESGFYQPGFTFYYCLFYTLVKNNGNPLVVLTIILQRVSGSFSSVCFGWSWFSPIAYLKCVKIGTSHFTGYLSWSLVTFPSASRCVVFFCCHFRSINVFFYGIGLLVPCPTIGVAVCGVELLVLSLKLKTHTIWDQTGFRLCTSCSGTSSSIKYCYYVCRICYWGLVLVNIFTTGVAVWSSG